MRSVICRAATACLLAAYGPSAHGQDAQTILQKLKSQFTATQITGNRSDIVTAGSILVLQKDRLLMYSIVNPIPPQSTYRKGKITHSLGGRDFLGDLTNTMGNASKDHIQQRIFVAGGKFWTLGAGVERDGVVFRVYSDPYDDVRYWGDLKFPYSKGSYPSADELMATIAEVLTVQPGDDAAAKTTPTPTDSDPQPKTISLGQTKDEVISTFGQPQKVVKLGAREISYYPDMKVTLVDGKVSDVADVPAK